jgi:lipopolysaccharide export system permease protein
VAIISRLDRYIGTRVLYSTLLVLAILLAFFAFVELADELSNYGRGNFGIYAFVLYIALKLPGHIYELFPTAILIGTVLGLSSLALGSELTAMRAAGVSVGRIVGSAMKTGVLFVAAGTLVGETIVPKSDTAAERGHAEALQVALQRDATGVWLRDGKTFVNIGEVLPDLSLLRVNIYTFDSAQHLQNQTYADSAHFKGNAWRLKNVSESHIRSNGVSTRKVAESAWRSVLTPEVVRIFAVRPESLSSLHLYEYIQHLRRNHQQTQRYELALWHKVLLPFATALMILLAVPAVFGQVRGGGTGQKVFFGILLGMGFHLLSQGFGYIGLLYGLSPPAAAILPVALFLFLAIYLLRKVA